MNHITDHVELPKILTDKQEDRPHHERGEPMQREKWAERLWPSMAWFIFLFNVFVALTYCVRLLIEGMGDVFNIAMYIVIVVTMCGTYMTLMWAHHNILRKDNGLG